MIWVILVCFAASMLLVFAEFIVPGGILGVFSGLLFLTGCWLAFTETGHGPLIVLSAFLCLGASILAGVYILSSTRLGSQMVLAKTQRASEGWTAPPEDPGLVGQVGEALTMLRPAGSILVADRRVDAVSGGSFIKKGSVIKVVQVEGHRVVVEQDEEGGGESGE